MTVFFLLTVIAVLLILILNVLATMNENIVKVSTEIIKHLKDLKLKNGV